MSYSDERFRKDLIEVLRKIRSELTALRKIESAVMAPKRYFTEDVINCMTCKYDGDCHKVLDCESSNFKHWESMDEEPKAGRYPWGVKTVPLNDTKE